MFFYKISKKNVLFLKSLSSYNNRIGLLKKNQYIFQSNVSKGSLYSEMVLKDYLEDSKIMNSKTIKSKKITSNLKKKQINKRNLIKQALFVKNQDCFWNQTFDKGRLKNFVLWFLSKHGEYKTVQLVEELKNIGFQYATKAGISLGVEDLKIPEKKYSLIMEAEQRSIETIKQYKRGEITGVERFQRLIDTWHRTSERLKQEVIDNFEATDILNPVYMMAFSGARGNISQVRQLVGMRGLMSNPQGQIIDFPIRSNFREGLTLTEYIISSYGARKGIVDTALRTANAGYLTRRLVDVAQHVIISNFDCGTKRGIFLTDMKEGNKTIYSLQNRLIGRVLARDIYNKQKIKIASRNTEISGNLANSIALINKKVFVRSTLTCQTKKLVCQLCYGWSLAQGNLVSIGEAVGVVAAQSIGEPGTQLTMRTFHTGGVFSGDVSDQIRAPFNGIVQYNNPIAGTLIRTPEGKIAFLTKNEGSFMVYRLSAIKNLNEFKKNLMDNKKSNLESKDLKKYKIPFYTLLFLRNGEKVFEKEVIAQISSINRQKNATDQGELTIKSELSGQFYSKILDLKENKVGPKLKNPEHLSSDVKLSQKLSSQESFNTQNEIIEFNENAVDTIFEAWGWGYAWVLSGKIYQLPLPSTLFPIFGDYVNQKTYMNQIKWNLASSFGNSFKLNIPFPKKMFNKKIIKYLRTNKNKNSIINNSIQSSTDKKDLILLKNDLISFQLSKIVYKKFGYFLKLTEPSSSFSFNAHSLNNFFKLSLNQELSILSGKDTLFLFSSIFSKKFKHANNKINNNLSLSHNSVQCSTQWRPSFDVLLNWFPKRLSTKTGGLILMEPLFFGDFLSQNKKLKSVKTTKSFKQKKNIKKDKQVYVLEKDIQTANSYITTNQLIGYPFKNTKASYILNKKNVFEKYLKNQNTTLFNSTIKDPQNGISFVKKLNLSINSNKNTFDKTKIHLVKSILNFENNPNYQPSSLNKIVSSSFYFSKDKDRTKKMGLKNSKLNKTNNKNILFFPTFIKRDLVKKNLGSFLEPVLKNKKNNMPNQLDGTFNSDKKLKDNLILGDVGTFSSNLFFYNQNYSNAKELSQNYSYTNTINLSKTLIFEQYQLKEFDTNFYTKLNTKKNKIQNQRFPFRLIWKNSYKLNNNETRKFSNLQRIFWIAQPFYNISIKKNKKIFFNKNQAFNLLLKDDKLISNLKDNLLTSLSIFSHEKNMFVLQNSKVNENKILSNSNAFLFQITRQGKVKSFYPAEGYIQTNSLSNFSKTMLNNLWQRKIFNLLPNNNNILQKINKSCELKTVFLENNENKLDIKFSSELKKVAKLKNPFLNFKKEGVYFFTSFLYRDHDEMINNLKKRKKMLTSFLVSLLKIKKQLKKNQGSFLQRSYYLNNKKSFSLNNNKKENIDSSFLSLKAFSKITSFPYFLNLKSINFIRKKIYNSDRKNFKQKSKKRSQLLLDINIKNIAENKIEGVTGSKHEFFLNSQLKLNQNKKLGFSKAKNTTHKNINKKSLFNYYFYSLLNKNNKQNLFKINRASINSNFWLKNINKLLKNQSLKLGFLKNKISIFQLKKEKDLLLLQPKHSKVINKNYNVNSKILYNLIKYYKFKEICSPYLKDQLPFDLLNLNLNIENLIKQQNYIVLPNHEMEKFKGYELNLFYNKGICYYQLKQPFENNNNLNSKVKGIEVKAQKESMTTQFYYCNSLFFLNERKIKLKNWFKNSKFNKKILLLKKNQGSFLQRYLIKKLTNKLKNKRMVYKKNLKNSFNIEGNKKIKNINKNRIKVSIKKGQTTLLNIMSKPGWLYYTNNLSNIFLYIKKLINPGKKIGNNFVFDRHPVYLEIISLDKIALHASKKNIISSYSTKKQYPININNNETKAKMNIENKSFNLLKTLKNVKCRYYNNEYYKDETDSNNPIFINKEKNSIKLFKNNNLFNFNNKFNHFFVLIRKANEYKIFKNLEHKKEIYKIANQKNNGPALYNLKQAINVVVKKNQGSFLSAPNKINKMLKNRSSIFLDNRIINNPINNKKFKNMLDLLDSKNLLEKNKNVLSSKKEPRFFFTTNEMFLKKNTKNNTKSLFKTNKKISYATNNSFFPKSQLINKAFNSINLYSNYKTELLNKQKITAQTISKYPSSDLKIISNFVSFYSFLEIYKKNNLIKYYGSTKLKSKIETVSFNDFQENKINMIKNFYSKLNKTNLWGSYNLPITSFKAINFSPLIISYKMPYSLDFPFKTPMRLFSEQSNINLLSKTNIFNNVLNLKKSLNINNKNVISTRLNNKYTLYNDIKKMLYIYLDKIDSNKVLKKSKLFNLNNKNLFLDYENSFESKKISQLSHNDSFSDKKIKILYNNSIILQERKGKVLSILSSIFSCPIVEYSLGKDGFTTVPNTSSVPNILSKEVQQNWNLNNVDNKKFISGMFGDVLGSLNQSYYFSNNTDISLDNLNKNKKQDHIEFFSFLNNSVSTRLPFIKTSTFCSFEGELISTSFTITNFKNKNSYNSTENKKLKLNNNLTLQTSLNNSNIIDEPANNKTIKESKSIPKLFVDNSKLIDEPANNNLKKQNYLNKNLEITKKVYNSNKLKKIIDNRLTTISKINIENKSIDYSCMILTKKDQIAFYFPFNNYKEIYFSLENLKKKNQYMINDLVINYIHIIEENNKDEKDISNKDFGDLVKDSIKNEENYNENEVNFKINKLPAGMSKQANKLLIGEFLAYGDQISPQIAIPKAGQIIHINNQKITIRQGQPIFVSPKAVLHKYDGDFIDEQSSVITLSYQQLKTGDIIQGIPKVEQFFEARTTKRGRLFRDSLSNLLKGLFKRYRSKLPLDQAVRQSFYKIQQIIVDGVQRVYRSQGVTIADKHLEVIVKQMTSKVRIIEGGQTGFFPGEIVDLDFVEQVNSLLMKKIIYEPLVLGITRASLEVDSFLSAASFQQTTRVLSKAAISRKKDFLNGLKENVILGNLIPAGTGYLVYLDQL